jgi:predicted permease
MSAWRRLWRRTDLDRQLDAELQDHLDRLTADHLAAGMPEAEARRRARLEFGGVEQVKEASRDARRLTLLDDLARDTRYAVRSLARSPGFTCVAVLSLSLGIGANTALFRVFDGMMIEQLPAAAPADLVAFRWLGPNRGIVGILTYGTVTTSEAVAVRSEPGVHVSGATFSLPVFRALQESSLGFSEIFAAAYGSAVNLSVGGRAELGSSQFVSGNYYQGLGVDASVGRLLTPADDVPGATAVVTLSASYFSRRFGRDETIIGRTVAVNGVAATIVGVEPPGLHSIGRVGRPSPDVTLPIAMEAAVRPDMAASTMPAGWWLMVMGRLAPGSTIDGAQASLDPVFRAATGEAGGERPRLVLRPGEHGVYDQPVGTTIPLLAVVFGIVLLLVCINVANLLLSRTETRQAEICTRMAIGASRRRVFRQLLTESVVLAAAGGAAGMVVAYAVTRLLVLFPYLTQAGAPNWRMAAFTGGASLLTGLAFGWVPAVRATLAAAQTFGSVAGRSSRARFGLGGALVVAQVGLSLVLLVGAGLFLRTIANLGSVDTGFRSENVVVFTIDPRFVGLDDHRVTDLYERVRQSLEAQRRVGSASFGTQALLSGTGNWSRLEPEGSSLSLDVATLSVHPTYFDTLEVPVLLGRGLSAADVREAPAVAVINETAARALFPGRHPLGQRFGRRYDELKVEVVGVVPDVAYRSVRERSPAMVFYPHAQEYTTRAQTFIVRTSSDPDEAIPDIREAVLRVNPTLPLQDLTTQRRAERDLLQEEVLFATISTIFGVLALVTAAIGLFGLLSYAVVTRTKEVGIRMALGAGQGTILRAILFEGLALTVGGIVAGLAGALAATRLVESLLFGVSPTDPGTIGAAALVLLGASCAAGYLPAARASRVDPVVALRHGR